MYLRYNIAIDIYSLAILLFVLLYSRQTLSRRQLSQRLFQAMALFTLILVVADLLSWLEGSTNPLSISLMRLGNFLQFALNTIVPSLYILYVHDQIHHDEPRTRKWLLFLGPMFLINLSLVVTGLFTGWFYTIDAQNIYHRGPLYALSLAQFAVLVAISLAQAIKNRHLLEKRTFWALVVFPLPPILAVVLQTMLYGMSLNMHGLTFSLLVIFFQIQNQSLHTDYLTGIYNRKKLEGTLRDRINNTGGKSGFSAIMIDLDSFKDINDNYGHTAGDTALVDTAKILQSALRKEDLIARYGGDEFVVLLDTTDSIALKTAVARVKSVLAAYNLSRTTPFELAFSVGYAVYDPASDATPDAFQKKLDRLMYEDKARKKT